MTWASDTICTFRGLKIERDATSGSMFDRFTFGRKGSGGGSVGRAVASYTRDPRFKIPTLAKFYLPIVN